MSIMTNPCREIRSRGTIQFTSWAERRIYFRRNKAARYLLSDPHKGSTDVVYATDGRMLYGKNQL